MVIDHVLRRTVKTLAGLTIEEADAALALEGSAQLRELIKKLGDKVLGRATPANFKLRAILANCRLVTSKRNSFVHSVWARTDNGEAQLFGHDFPGPVPTAADLN
jgi:hypothetical protein